MTPGSLVVPAKLPSGHGGTGIGALSFTGRVRPQGMCQAPRHCMYTENFITTMLQGWFMGWGGHKEMGACKNLPQQCVWRAGRCCRALPLALRAIQLGPGEGPGFPVFKNTHLYMHIYI